MAPSSSGTFERGSTGGMEVVQSDDSMSAIDRMFRALLLQIENQNWQTARIQHWPFNKVCKLLRANNLERRVGGNTLPALCWIAFCSRICFAICKKDLM